MKRITIILMAGLFMLPGLRPLPSIVPRFAWAGETTEYGAQAAKMNPALSVEEMLHYALQDEYLARATYRAVIGKFGDQRPFSNIIRAEEQHIGILRDLFAARKLNFPKDTAASHVTVPANLREAFETGVKAEVENIAMYDEFLKKELPSDVRSAFTRLRDASKNHLAAFQRNLDRKR